MTIDGQLDDGGLPAPPLFVVDDDRWLYVYGSLRKLLDDVDYSFTDDVEAAFDGHARPIDIQAGPDHVRVVVRDPAAALEQLQDRVDAFFAAWTHDAPPARTDVAGVYVPALLAAYGGRHERRRKRP